MFWRMLCATLSLVEKLSGKIRHKHVSELHVIIYMNHLCSWLAWQERIRHPAILTFITALGEGSGTGETCRLKKTDNVREPDLLVLCWII